MTAAAITPRSVAELLATLRRAAGAGGLAIADCPDPVSPDECAALAVALATCPVPLAAATGAVVGRGALVSVLAADAAYAPADATLAPDWAEAPGLAALLARQLHRAAAHAALSGRCSPLALLAEAGHLHAVEDPAAAAAASAERWRRDAGAARRRRALLAAAELPLAEAARFDALLWSDVMQEGEAK